MANKAFTTRNGFSKGIRSTAERALIEAQKRIRSIEADRTLAEDSAQELIELVNTLPELLAPLEQAIAKFNRDNNADLPEWSLTSAVLHTAKGFFDYWSQRAPQRNATAIEIKRQQLKAIAGAGIAGEIGAVWQDWLEVADDTGACEQYFEVNTSEGQQFFTMPDSFAEKTEMARGISELRREMENAPND